MRVLDGGVGPGRRRTVLGFSTGDLERLSWAFHGNPIPHGRPTAYPRGSHTNLMGAL